MKQALEIDDLHELTELLTARKQQIIFANGRFAKGSLTRRSDFSATFFIGGFIIQEVVS
jgi:hypothetical protein